MNKISLLLFLVCALLPNQGFSGFKTGNGGGVAYCTSSKFLDTKIFTYDLYEGVTRYSLKVNLSTEDGDYIAKAHDIVSRLDSVDDHRSRRYHDWIEQFQNSAKFLQGVKLFEVDDVGTGFLPSDCEYRQAIVQREPLSLGDKRYLIDDGIWKDLNEDQKAALVVHEIIYREANEVENLHPTSERVRFFNAIVHSLTKDRLPNNIEWVYIIDAAKLSYAGVNGFNIRVFYSVFDANRSAVLSKDSPIYFFEDRKIKTAILPSHMMIDISGNTFYQYCQNNMYKNTSTIQFHSTGKASAVEWPECSELLIKRSSTEEVFEINGIKYDAEGRPTSFRVKNRWLPWKSDLVPLKFK